MTTRGTLIVIDGADGAGKATQTKLLVERLRQERYQTETLSFPQYGENVAGRLLRECLDGVRGDFLSLDPRIASMLYAVDRYETRPKLEAWLAAGKMVVLDRYVSSNMLHQGSKIHNDETKLTEFLRWLDILEHTVFALPRPDQILYLDVPFQVRKQLMETDVSRASLDQVEQDVSYQVAAEACSKRLLATMNNWVSIDCTDGSSVRSREAIHEQVWQVCRDILPAI